MSSISLTGSSSLLYPLLSNSTASNDPLLTANTGGTSSIIGSNSSLTQELAAFSGVHTKPGAHGDLFQQIQQAVTSALQSIQSGSSSNPNQIIEQAIAQALQGTNGASGATGASTDSDGDNDNSGGGAASSLSGAQSFFQTLQENGIDPQQFRSDFLSAIQQAQQGNPNSTTTAFSSFPLGLSVDAAA